ncbi:MAG: o-succinylbenzoate synthase [Chloroflexota bacterium]
MERQSNGSARLGVSLYPYMLKFKRPAGTSRGFYTEKQTFLIRLTSPEMPDCVGWGECGPMPKLSIDEQKHDTIRPEHIYLDILTRFCQIFDRPEYASYTLETLYSTPNVWQNILDCILPTTNTHSRDDVCLSQLPALAFGIETALRDLCNGGQQQLFDTSFSKGETSLLTHGLIWMDTVEGLLTQVDQKVAVGFRVIKMKVGALLFEDELKLLTEIRRRYPPEQITLRLDANGAYTPESALSILEQLAPLDIHFLEQPIPAGNWQEMAAICAQSPIPIALDEELIGPINPSLRRELLQTIRPQHIVIKPTLLGGFTVCEQWIDDATEVGCEWWINSLLESNVGLNALCQWTSLLETAQEQRIHGMGTGTLFANNIPAPIALDGNRLRYQTSPTSKWNFSKIT